MHTRAYYKAYYVRCKNEKRCCQCGSAVLDGTLHCTACKEKNKLSYTYKKDRHLCTKCGVSINKGATCKDCKQKQHSSYKKLRAQRKSMRLCARCGVSVLKGLNCEKCKEIFRHDKQCRDAMRLLAGACLQCGAPVATSRYCERHWFERLSWAHFHTIKLAERLKDLLLQQNSRCLLTGRLLEIGKNASIDHKIPKSRGGPNDINNLQWVDLDVNYAKSDLSQEAFIQLAKEITDYASRPTSNN